MGFERGASGNGASRVFACALDADDALWCWGAGVGNLKTPQAQQPGSRFSAAWVGPGSNGGPSPLVGRDEDGKFFVWGKNNQGLISSSNVNAFIENPLPLYEDETVRSAVLGFSHLCALVGDEDPVVRCRGDNAQGQTGNTEITEITGLDDGTDLDTPAFVSVFAGLSFSCGLTAEGIAHCWGTRTVGQLGNGTVSATGSPTPTAVSGDHRFISLSLGSNVACGLTEDRETFCWGSGQSGRLGNGDEESATKSKPVLVVGTGR